MLLRMENIIQAKQISWKQKKIAIFFVAFLVETVKSVFKLIDKRLMNFISC